MTVPLLELSGLGVRFGRTPVLRGVDLVVPEGGAVGVVGANGSGKTTLLRVLATLVHPSEGSGVVLGAGLGTEQVYRARQHIGLIGHRPAVYPQLTVAENLHFIARVRGLPDDRVGWALQAVGLAAAAGRPAGRASWGMQRRVELARLLLTEPRLVLLDEPYSGLDAAAAGLVDRVVEQVMGRSGSVVLASPGPQPLEHLVDRVYQLDEGALSLLPGVSA